MQDNSEYICQLAQIEKLFYSLREHKIDKEKKVFIKAYNFDDVKKSVLPSKLSMEETDLKSADGFWYDNSAKTIYLIEWTDSDDKKRTPKEFVEKFAHSLLLLGFLTAATSLNFSDVNLKCWSIRKEINISVRPREFSQLETNLKSFFRNAEVRYNNVSSTDS